MKHFVNTYYDTQIYLQKSNLQIFETNNLYTYCILKLKGTRCITARKMKLSLWSTILFTTMYPKAAASIAEVYGKLFSIISLPAYQNYFWNSLPHG